MFLAPALAACGEGASEPEPPLEPVWLDELSGGLPPTIGELGLYPRLPDTAAPHRAAVAFQPLFELWSNGTRKQRFLFLPAGTQIDTSSRESWEFPIGTLITKTFSAPRVDEAGEAGAEQPIETRVLRRDEDGWQYAVYLWNEDGSDAELADIATTHRVMLEIDGERFEHVVPARLDCRKCHESQPSTVIGFRELGLSSELAALHQRGVLSDVPAEPRTIEHADPPTREVLGYLEGNCTHCHNGGDGASSAFDLRHDVALDNLIGQETEGEALAGIRVVPGQPEESAVYLALSRAENEGDIQAMPPVGVQRADAGAIDLFRDWIAGIAP